MAGEDTAGAGESFDPFGPAGSESEGAPDPGQGTSEPEGVFAPYLQEVPEEHRAVVSGYLKDAEKNVNSKLRDAADLQSRFGDYKDIDLSGIPPEQLASVVAFVKDVGSSPDTYQEWLRNEAIEAGLIQAEQQTAETEDPDLEQYIQGRIEQALSPVAQKLAQFEQTTQEQQRAQAEAALTKQVETSFERIEAEHKIQLTDEQQEAILALAEHVDGDDFVEQGFNKLRALEGGAQAGFVKDKTSQPAPSLRTGGQPAPAKGKTFADVREQALEIINQTL